MSNTALDSVAAAFKQWRDQRKNRKEKIPENLWSMAVSLYPEYKCSHICQRLGLSGGSFKKRMAPERLLSNDGFVLAATVPVRGTTENAGTEAVLLGIQGQQRQLTLKVNIDALSRVLPQLEALL